MRSLFFGLGQSEVLRLTQTNEINGCQNFKNVYVAVCFLLYKRKEKEMLHLDDRGVCTFTINRPEVRNAINYEVIEELSEAITFVESNKQVKVFVITGAGDRAFCSGGDLSVFHQLHTKEEALGMLTKMGEVLYRLFTLPVITVAYINGVAVGGGCEIATACDFRFARKGIKLGFVQGKIGITTGWGGATMLREKLPYDKALKLLASAKVILAEEAQKIGFVHELVEDTIEPLMEAYISQSPEVLRAYKQAVSKKFSCLREDFFREIEACATLWESPEHIEAVNQFLKK